MEDRQRTEQESRMGMGYGRFFAMIATSTAVMFGLMYLNTYLVSHVFFSETRAYMAIVMGATMAIIMLAFMLSMYRRKAVNIAIFAGAAIVFAFSLFLVRSQITVGDTSYMRAMIPHHSIAIMTSSRANISDPRVRKLADEIIYAQDKEIAEMRYLIASTDASGDAAASPATSPARVMPLAEALASADVATLDPQFLTDEDLTALPQRAACTFAYTKESEPVLAVAADGAALIKLSADLVRLQAAEPVTVETGAMLSTDGLTLCISAPGSDTPLMAAAGQREADLFLRLDDGLTTGYRGAYSCGDERRAEQ